MTDKCPSCGVADEERETDAQAAFDAVAACIGARQDLALIDGKLPAGFGQAILGGFMQAIVASACGMAGDKNHDQVQAYLVELLHLAIEDEKAMPSTGTVQ